MAVQATHTTKPCYIFTNSWVIAKGLAICSGEWQLNDWTIKGFPVWGQELCQQLVAWKGKIYVNAHGKGLFKMEHE